MSLVECLDLREVNKLGEPIANGGRTLQAMCQAPFVVEELNAAA